MNIIKFPVVHALVVCLALTLLSPFSLARGDIVFATGLPVDNEIFSAGEELLAAISRRMGETIKLISIPGKRSATLLKNNEIHAELARVDEYSQKVPFAIKIPEPIIETTQYAYSLKENLPVNGWGSLKAYRSVALRGTWIIEIYMAEQQVTWVDSVSSALKFLKSGRADIFISSSVRANKFIIANDYSTIHRLEPAIHTTRDFTFFAKAYPQLARRYEAALRSIKADGVYQAILTKYDIW